VVVFVIFLSYSWLILEPNYRFLALYLKFTISLPPVIWFYNHKLYLHCRKNRDIYYTGLTCGNISFSIIIFNFFQRSFKTLWTQPLRPRLMRGVSTVINLRSILTQTTFLPSSALNVEVSEVTLFPTLWLQLITMHVLASILLACFNRSIT
jgi:hypothetical protein